MTLVETVVALAIGIFISFMMVAIVTTGSRVLGNAKISERLHVNSTFITDALIYWVKQAKVIETPNSETLIVTLPDFSKKTIAKSGNRVVLDGGALTSDDVSVGQLTFVKIGRSVRASFRIESGTQVFSATTTVAQRNEL